MIANFIATRGVIFNSQHEILIVSRDNIIWELPGGGLEYDKSSTEMCIQETYEETGLNVEIEHFIGIFEYSMKKDDIITRTIIQYFKCKIIGSEIFDPNWKDLAYDVIKFRKFVNEIDFKKLNARKSMAINRLTIANLKIPLKNQYFLTPPSRYRSFLPLKGRLGGVLPYLYRDFIGFCYC